MVRFAYTLLLVSIAVSQIACEDPKMMEFFQQCSSEVSVPEDDMNNLKEHKEPVTREGMCFVACFLQKMKLMTDDGKIDVNGSLDAIAKANLPQEVKDKMVQVTEFCVEDVKNKLGDDKCENAKIMSTCSKVKGKELGLVKEDYQN